MNETISRRVAKYQAVQRREAKKRKRKRRRQIIFLFLILAAILCYYYKSNTDDIEVKLSQDNTQREFLTLDQVKNQLTPDMYTREVNQYERDRLSDFCNSHSEMSDKIKFLSDNLSAYPSYAVSSLLGSPDKIDYILAYPIMKGTSAVDDITINIEKGKLPYLLQWDSRWGYAPYGDSIGFCGCAPTCLSMVAIGLTGNTELTPDAISNFALNGGYYLENCGTKWSLMTECASNFGLVAYDVGVDEDTMHRVLNEGGKLICSVSPGDFTSTGHFIVINGTSRKGFTVLDPNNVELSKKFWSFSVLAPQIAGMWACYPE